MSKTTSKQPTHRAYAVTKQGQRNFWREIGAAWANSKGFNLKLDYLPLNGADIVILEAKDTTDRVEGGAP